MPLSIVHATGPQISQEIHLLNRDTNNRAIDGPAFAFSFTTGAETVDERDRFVAWMTHRAGIASTLDPSQPYRSAPPTV